MVEVLAPGGHQIAGMAQGVEEVLFQQLVPHPAVEALHKAVLYGLAGGDVVPLDLAVGSVLKFVYDRGACGFRSWSGGEPPLEHYGQLVSCCKPFSDGSACLIEVADGEADQLGGGILGREGALCFQGLSQHAAQ